MAVPMANTPEKVQAIRVSSRLPMMAGKIPPSEPKINPWGELNKNSLLILPRPRDIV
jgi:hypothetical protein